MFEDFKEAAEKEVQRKKVKHVINITTGLIFSVTLILLMFYSN